MSTEPEPSFDGFLLVQKNRNANIHWLLQLVHRIEQDWASEALRMERLALLRRCLETCQEHAHPDVQELGSLAPRMMRRLDFDERHFLNLMLPFERKHSKGVRDHEFLVTTDDRPAEQAAVASSRLPLTLVLDHLRSAFNVGAIFRTADCIGVEKILACGYTATPDDSTVQKTSLGAWEHVPWEWRKDTAAAIDELRAAGTPVIALETVPTAPMVDEFAFPRDGCALLLGNERHGCSPELLAKCDAVVRLPARGVKNSMNVGVALGMCGYEITRQWTRGLPASSSTDETIVQQTTTTGTSPSGGCAGTRCRLRPPEADEAIVQQTTTSGSGCAGNRCSGRPAEAALASLPDAAADTSLKTAAELIAVATERRQCIAAATERAEAGEYTEAVAIFRRAVEIRPCEKALEGLAQCLMELDDAPGAVVAAKAAVEHEPQWAIGWLTLGRASLNSEAFGEAVTALRRALVLDPALADEVKEDLEAAERLSTRASEGEMILHDKTRLRLQQGRDEGVRHGVSTVIWECGIVLAKLIDRAAAGVLPTDSPLHTHGVLPLHGRRAIELGSGTGVLGVAVAALGSRVLLTDVPDALDILRRNAQLNEEAITTAGGAVSVHALTWEEPDQLPDGAAECELVLAADLLYQRDGLQLGPLCEVLRRLMAPSAARTNGGLLLLAHKSRHGSLDASMHEALRDRAGIVLSEVPFEQHHRDFRSPAIKCFVGQWVAGARPTAEVTEGAAHEVVPCH